MSIICEVSRDEAIPGLRLKRRLGGKIHITHKGETITLQVVRFESGYQVVLAFCGSPEFAVLRDEAVDTYGLGEK